MLCTEIVSDIQNNFWTQHVLSMFCKKKSFWQRFICTFRHCNEKEEWTTAVSCHRIFFLNEGRLNSFIQFVASQLFTSLDEYFEHLVKYSLLRLIMYKVSHLIYSLTRLFKLYKSDQIDSVFNKNFFV